MTTERPGHPHANSALARFLERRIDELRGLKSQREIATAAGFKRPNVLSMFKTGETLVPVDRIPALAKALNVDAVHLLRLRFQDPSSELGPVIAEITGRHMATANERAILLDKWRAASRNADPAPNARINAAVDRMLADLIKVIAS
jgi:transcriptional regulator with XRE-family HTH domain